MAENEKKSRKLSPEILLNRQINYTILKMLWTLREDKKPISDFYIETGINRNRYRSIVTNDETRTPRLKEVAEYLSKKSGVPEEVYLGETTFSLKEISTDEWKDYFQNINEIREIEEYNRDKDSSDISTKEEQEKRINESRKEFLKDDCKTFERKLIALLKIVRSEQNGDVKLYSAYSYYVDGEIVNSTEIQAKLNRLTKQMKEITFTQLESLPSKELEAYKSQLDRQSEMILALNSYRKFKNI